MSDAPDSLTSKSTREGVVTINGTEHTFKTTAPTQGELNALDEEHSDVEGDIEWACIIVENYLDSFDGEPVESVDAVPIDRVLLLHSKIQEAWTADIQAAVEEMGLDEGNP